MSVDRLELCCGPFCAECHTGMEQQDARIRALEAACRVMAAEIMAKRKRINGDADIHGPTIPPEELRKRSWIRGVDARSEGVTNKDPLASKFIEEARNG